LKFNKNQTLGFTSKLSNFEIVNQEFIRCKCYMLATGDNVNGSDITLEAVQKAMARGEFYNKPVIAHLYQDPEDNNKWRVGGHDSKWIITNTSFDIVNECIPFGCIPESANLQLEEVLEADGETMNTYLTCQIILWTGRYNIMDAAYSDDIYFNQSCELSINEYHYKNNDVLSIDDFTFSALCLLNKSSDNSKNVRPCFPSCRVEKMKAFSIDTDKFKQNFELMLEKLKQYESDGTSTSATASVQNNTTNNNPQMEGENKMDLTKFTTLLSDIKCEGNDYIKYELLSVDESKIYVLDKENGCRIFSVEYVMSNDDPVINWKTKTEGDITFTEKSEEKDSRLTMIYNELNESLAKKHEALFNEKLEEKLQEVSQQFETKNKELQTEYDTLKTAYSIAKEKLSIYEAAENEKVKQDHIEAVKSTLERFEKKIGKSPEFIYFKAKLGDYETIDIEKLDKDLTLMSGEILINSNKNKMFSYTPTSTNVNKYSTENELTSRYGHLLDGFVD